MSRTTSDHQACFVPGPIRHGSFVLASLSVLLGAVSLSATPASAQTGLQFNGTTQYITMGAAPSLNATSFTLECWVKRSSTSTVTTTGTGGWANIYPLITKGRGEAETPANLNMNYFLGIRSDGVLSADFEEPTGPNHPLGGTNALLVGVWYHVATTFDQSTGRYRLYVNGEIQKDTTLTGGIAPASTSIQHSAIATAMTSTGVAQGEFGGTIDEVRIWNVARTPAEIQGNLFNELTSGTGLIGRWGLNDGSGTTAANSIGGGVNGTLVASPTWVGGSPFGFGMQFAGTSGYGTFGNPAALQLSQFTLEMWVRRDATGVGTSTGTGGIADAVPLIAKGRAEAETPTQDINYLLGISQSSGKLVADFEEAATGTTPSLNHPITGTGVIAADGTWHHVAASYDGTTWRLYLDGSIDASLAVGQPPAASSISPASIGSALTSTGVAAGFFNGAVDEVRVWNTARSAADIASTINSRLTSPQTGLVARWGLDEGYGMVVRDTSGSSAHGNMLPVIPTSAWNWAGGAPFNITPPSPPADPSGLLATAISYGQITVIWTDNSSNETSFELERSTTGSSGPYSLLVSLPAGTTSYDDVGLTASTQYCYRVRAVGSGGPSGYAASSCVTTLAPSASSLDFGGTNAYLNAGTSASLQLPQFTLEMWIRRDGTGVGTSTGAGGIADAVPLIAKGRAEDETAAHDVNYLFGISQSSGKLVADFEEGATGASPSLNHPITGNTVIPVNGSVWHHVAATYDGTAWKLYLDGQLDGSLSVGQPPASGSTVAVAIGSALTSTGVASGFFDGAIDEVHVWNRALTATEIQDGINQQPTSGTGLVSRWGLNEGASTYAFNSIPMAPARVTGANFTWGASSPFSAVVTHSITASSGGNGVVTPAGVTAVPHHGSQSYTIAPLSGYRVADVLVDGVSVGTPSSYNFTDVTADHTISATFAVDEYTLTYSGNGNTGGAAPVDPSSPYNFNSTVTVLGAGTLTRTGYTFAGWNTAANGSGTSYAPAATFSIAANTTLYAQWTIDTYTVAYDGNGNTGGAAPVDPSSPYNFNATVTVLGAGSLIRTGHTFAGWNTAANGSGTSYAPAATFSIAANTTLYAQWTIDTYTVAYDGNGNTGGAAPVDPSSPYNFNSTVTVLGAGTLTRTGYTFAGWNTAANGSGTSYAPAATFSIAANTTLYAQWTIDTYTISYVGNGNTGGAAPVDPSSPYDYNTTVTVLGAGTLTKTGHMFAGWNTAANGSGTSYAPATTFSITANTTLYAQWTINTFTVAYDGNGNTGGAAPVDPSSPYSFNSTVTVLGAGSLIRTGYTFAGWNTAANGSGTGYAPAATFSIAANTTLYAQWTIDTYTVAYDGNGNTGGAVPVDPSSPYNFNSTVTVLGAGTLTRTGYTFAGWNTAANGSGTGYAPAATFAIAANTTLYAQWTIDTYTVAYDGNGNTGGAAPVDPSSPYNFNATVTVLGAGSLIRTGHTFAGWNTAANGSGTSYAPAATFSIAANTTLYAQWTINSYTVAYDGNGNTGGAAPVDPSSPYNFNSTVTVLGGGTLTRTGYTFAGWNTAANGSGTSYAPAATFSISSNTTLYAQWTIDTYTVAYDGNGNTGGAAPVDPSSPYNVNSTVTVLGAGTLTRTGYTFAGWNTAANGSGTSHAPAGTFSIAANTTLYAQWTINSYTVVYDGNTNDGGTAPVDPSSPYNFNSTVTVLGAGSLTKTGYSFAGWNTAANGSGTGYAAAGTFSIAANTTLYAQWTINTFTLVYDGNTNDGGTAPVDPSSPYGYNTTVTVLGAGTLTKAEYTFTGWNTAADGSGTSYAPSATFSITTNTTFYAQWTSSGAEFALDLGSANAYVNFGAPASLQLTQLTIEMWMRRDGAGTGTNTGTGGIADAIPLLAKGRADAEDPTKDINYLFGIKASSGALCADFEEGPGGSSPSLNHPIIGTTPVTSGVWHHVAVTYDGTWKLYLDGALDGSLAVNQPLGSASTVAVSLGTALTQAGVASGFFDGATDEVRIWNVARTQAQIQSTINSRISTPQAGLVARWALDEGSGTTVAGSAGTTINGSIVGTGSSWIGPAPFNATANGTPQITALISPTNGATDVSLDPTLEVQVSDPENDPVSVSFYGRVQTATPGPDFTLIGLPDTQYYAGQLNGGSPAIMTAQTQWIVDQRDARNIAYAVQLGDCVEHGDNGGDDIEWQRANASFSLIENPVTTGMPEGMPYGVCVGNHDQSPTGDANGTTAFYNQYFGESRFNGRTYYGGHYGTNNNNWYDLFSASGMDFIVISMEYNVSPSAAVLSWADGLLTTYADRRAIIATHNLVGAGNPAAFSIQGAAIYNALRGHSNLFLMLGGHVTEEGRRTDTYNGNTVYSVLSDYQARANGGNGWLRIYEFSPANNVIRVRTFSPWLNQYEADADSSSQFTLPYDMSSTVSYALIGTVNGVASGGTASVEWPGLTANANYEWYATASDAGGLAAGPVWHFTTGSGVLAADQGLPGRVSFSPVSPNPSINSAHVMLELPTWAWTRVDVMDIQGRVVATLADGSFSPGRHDISWSVSRTKTAPGLFFLRAKVGHEVFVRRFTVIR